MPEGAVNVARPTKWGNPWRAERAGKMWRAAPCRTPEFACREDAVAWCIGRYRFHAEKVIQYGWNSLGWASGDLTDLRGRDLACWCPLDQPCHADVLLELANA